MLNAVHFCSGGGTTFQEVASQANSGALGDIKSVLMVASKDGIGALKRADSLRVSKHILEDTRNSQEILGLLDRVKADVVSLNGYLPILPQVVIEEFTNKGGILLNQHPGILRADHMDFGGNEKEMGMYGSRVTAATILYILEMGLEGDDVFTESSVHHVTPKVDDGAVVGVIKFPFAEKLEAFKQESGIIRPDQLMNIDFSNLNNQYTQAIKKFTGEIQALLLLMEHQNVINVFRRLGNGENRLETAIDYGTPYAHVSKKSHLEGAKRRAVQLFPKG